MKKEVEVKITGDASQFIKTVKKTKQFQEDLSKVTDKYKSSGLKQHKELSKITNKFNKGQKSAGKEALQLEKRLQHAMNQTIRLMREKQKSSKNTRADLEAELRTLRKLEEQYKSVRSFRKGTGVRSGRERMSGMGSMAAAGMAGAAGMAATAIAYVVSRAVSAVTSQIREGYAGYVNFGRALGGLAGTDANMDPFKLNSDNTTYSLTGFGRSQKMGFSATETVHHMRASARATGSVRNAVAAQAYSRGYGGDPGEVMNLMGGITRGMGDFGRKGQRELERIMQHSFKSGMDKSRAGEAMAAVGQAIQIAGSSQAGSVDASGVSALLTYFSRTGNAGLQGARGLQTIGAIDSTLKGYGRISVNQESAKALAMQSMGYGLAGGDSSTFMDVTRRLQQGVFGKGGAKNMIQFARGIGAASGGMRTQEASYMLSGMSNISMDQADAVLDAVADGGPNLEARISEIMEESLPVDQQIAKATKNTHKTLERIARLDNRLVEFGRASAGAIESIEHDINELISRLMPHAIRMLEAIARAVGWIGDLIATLPGIGETFRPGDKKAASDLQNLRTEAASAKTPEQMRTVLSQLDRLVQDTPMPNPELDGWSTEAARNRVVIGRGARVARARLRARLQEKTNPDPNALPGQHVREAVLRERLRFIRQNSRGELAEIIGGNREELQRELDALTGRGDSTINLPIGRQLAQGIPQSSGPSHPNAGVVDVAAARATPSASAQSPSSSDTNL